MSAFMVSISRSMFVHGVNPTGSPHPTQGRGTAMGTALRTCVRLSPVSRSQRPESAFVVARFNGFNGFTPRPGAGALTVASQLRFCHDTTRHDTKQARPMGARSNPKSVFLRLPAAAGSRPPAWLYAIPSGGA